MASEDRALVQIPAAGLFVSALLTGMNLAVRRAPFGDWWVPLGLAAVGVGLMWVTRPREARAGAVEAAAPTTTHTYTITATSSAPPPAPDRISPQPAPIPGHTARTEHADAEAGARLEGEATSAPQPSPDKGEEIQPEIDPVLEKTAAPQQPHEVEQAGGILTPEAVSEAVESPQSAEQTPGTGPVEQADPAITEQAQAAGDAAAPDDLLIIHGIGPKINAALLNAGIRTFADLAAADEQRLLDILTTANVRFIDKPSFWIAQAGYAARGDMDGMRRYIAENRPFEE
jgi:predicted flap endonuclease-1-like 5' DNA nuclease